LLNRGVNCARPLRWTHVPFLSIYCNQKMTGQQPGFGAAGAGPGFGAGQVDEDEVNPWTAAANGNLELLQHSLQHLNLHVTAADEGQGYTIFHAASSYSQLDILEWLLSQAATEEERQLLVNAVDHEGDSALHYAGTAASARFLVERANIDINIKNEADMTALDAKAWELEETMSEDDFDEENADYIHLKDVVEYIRSVSNVAQ
jgi:ankyrin repeat protein